MKWMKWERVRARESEWVSVSESESERVSLNEREWVRVSEWAKCEEWGEQIVDRRQEKGRAERGEQSRGERREERRYGRYGRDIKKNIKKKKFIKIQHHTSPLSLIKKMEFLFGPPPPTPKEISKGVKRDMSRGQRDLDKEYRQLERQEAKLIQETKLLAKKGDMSSAKLLAKDIVRIRDSKTKLIAAKSTMRSVSTRATVSSFLLLFFASLPSLFALSPSFSLPLLPCLSLPPLIPSSLPQTAATTHTVGKAMAGASRGMAASNAAMDPARLQATVPFFSLLYYFLPSHSGFCLFVFGEDLSDFWSRGGRSSRSWEDLLFRFVLFFPTLASTPFSIYVIFLVPSNTDNLTY
jgi:hypothetical protein